MRNRLLALAASPLLLSLAVLADAPKAEPFGKPLAGAQRVALADLQKSPDAWAGKTIRTEGPVSAVCQRRGCWMALGAGKDAVRVTFKDYGFFVPKDIAGATATVEGVFSVHTVPEATAKHYAGETPGGKPDEIKGDQKELSFEATGVEIRRAK
jgi:uncharacterized protein DUF4920